MLIIDNALDTAIEITENHILVIEGKEAIKKAKERQTIRLKRLIYGESEARNMDKACEQEITTVKMEEYKGNEMSSWLKQECEE